MFEILSKPEKRKIKAGESPPMEPPDPCVCSAEDCSLDCDDWGSQNKNASAVHSSADKG